MHDIALTAPHMGDRYLRRAITIVRGCIVLLPNHSVLTFRGVTMLTATKLPSRMGERHYTAALVGFSLLGAALISSSGVYASEANGTGLTAKCLITQKLIRYGSPSKERVGMIDVAKCDRVTMSADKQSPPTDCVPTKGSRTYGPRDKGLVKPSGWECTES